MIIYYLFWQKQKHFASLTSLVRMDDTNEFFVLQSAVDTLTLEANLMVWYVIVYLIDMYSNHDVFRNTLFFSN